MKGQTKQELRNEIYNLKHQLEEKDASFAVLQETLDAIAKSADIMNARQKRRINSLEVDLKSEQGIAKGFFELAVQSSRNHMIDIQDHFNRGEEDDDMEDEPLTPNNSDAENDYASMVDELTDNHSF